MDHHWMARDYLTQRKLALTERGGDSSKGDGEEPYQVGHWYTCVVT